MSEQKPKEKHIPKTKLEKNKETIQAIAKNYRQWEKSIAEQLLLNVPNHGTSTGSYREALWMSFFRTIIPKKFSIERSVFIIDSHGEVSREVDLAVYDESYTPYIFHQGDLRFIPIEAVAAVIECKSKRLPSNEWVESIQCLRTGSRAFARFANSIIKGEDENPKATQTSTRPLLILCHVAKSGGKIESKFDFVIKPRRATKENQEKGLSIIPPNQEDLKKCYLQLNHSQKSESDCTQEQSDELKKLDGIKISDYSISEKGETLSVLSFVFQLNQILMLINNPLIFPHLDYIKMFEDNLE